MKHLLIKLLFLLLIFFLPNLVQAYQNGEVSNVAPKEAFNYDAYQACQELIYKCPAGIDSSNVPNDMCVWRTLNSSSVCSQTFNLIKLADIDEYIATFSVTNLGFKFYSLYWTSTLADGIDNLFSILTPNMQIISLGGVIQPNWAEVKQKLKIPSDRSPTLSVFGGDESVYFDKARSAITFKLVIPIADDSSLHGDLFGYVVALLKFSPDNELKKIDFQYLDSKEKPLN